MEQIKVPSYTPPVGKSPFMASTHFAQRGALPVALSDQVTLSPSSQLSFASSVSTNAQSPSSLSVSSQNPRFSSSALIRSAEAFNNVVLASRGRELLIVDLLGFALMRSAMDLSREYLYKDTINNKRSFNWASARERLIMEIAGGVVSDSLVGFLGYGIASALDKRMGGVANHFIDVDKMKLFSETLKKSDAKTARQFVAQLAKDIGGAKSAQILPTVQKAVLNGLDSEVASAQIAKTLRNPHFDRVIRGGTHAVDSLLGDAKLFVDSVTKRASNPNAWNQAAKSVLTQTNRINAFRIPVGLGAGVVFNFAMPYMIQAFTRNISGINDYPGESGLRELKHTDKEHDKKRGLFPYLKESLQRGNVLPLLISFVPLPIVLGMIDTDKLSVHGLKASFNNPFKPGYMKRFMSMMQFSRKVPYIGGQQMALLYALVVFSRVAAARTSIEFRERTVDAFLGWSIWILANPWMKKKIAQWSDKAHGTKLIKTVGGLSSVRTEAEVKRLITNPVLRQKSLNRLTLISAGSTIATILLLGIAEPYLSIRLTEWQAHKLNKKRPETTVE